MNTTTQLSQALDLTPNEIKVYQGFVNNPGVSAAKISSILHMDKSSAYRSVNNLVEYGLLFPTPQGDTMTYTPADPEELRERFDSKVQALRNAEGSIKDLVSSLISSSTRKTHVRTETGIAAVQKTIAESLASKEKLIRELYRAYDFFHEDKAHVQFIIDCLHKRVKNKIWIHQFETGVSKQAPEFREYSDKSSIKYLKERRILPQGLDDMNSLRIWDDTTNIYSEDEQGEMLVITITDKYIASFMKKVFDFIWNQSKPSNQE